MRTQPVNPTQELEEHKQLMEDMIQDDFYLVQQATKYSLTFGLDLYKLNIESNEIDIISIKMMANRTYNNYISHILKKEVINI